MSENTPDVTVYILCGIIGSGKSTWAKEKAKEDNVVIVNRDSLRAMIKGKYVFDKKYEPFIRSACYDIVTTAFDYGFNIIIDETNIIRKKRLDWIDLVDMARQDRGVNMKIVLVHFTETQNNVDNRMNDPKGQSRETWQGVYEGMMADFEDPIEAELSPEGEIIKVEI